MNCVFIGNHGDMKVIDVKISGTQSFEIPFTKYEQKHFIAYQGRPRYKASS